MRLISAIGSTKKIYNILVERRGLIEGYFYANKANTGQQ